MPSYGYFPARITYFHRLTSYCPTLSYTSYTLPWLGLCRVWWVPPVSLRSLLSCKWWHTFQPWCQFPIYSSCLHTLCSYFHTLVCSFHILLWRQLCTISRGFAVFLKNLRCCMRLPHIELRYWHLANFNCNFHGNDCCFRCHLNCWN